MSWEQTAACVITPLRVAVGGVGHVHVLFKRTELEPLDVLHLDAAETGLQVLADDAFEGLDAPHVGDAPADDLLARLLDRRTVGALAIS